MRVDASATYAHTHEIILPRYSILKYGMSSIPFPASPHQSSIIFFKHLSSNDQNEVNANK